MSTSCERCGAARSISRPGTSPVACERCGVRPGAGGEASGLIDVRAMAALLGPTPVRPITPIASSFHSLSLPAPQPAAPRRPVPVRASQTPLHVLLGVLVFGVVGLAGAVVHSAVRVGPHIETVVVEAAPTTAVDQEAEDDVDEQPTPRAEPEPVAEVAAPIADTPQKPSRPRSGKPGKPTPTLVDKPQPEKTTPAIKPEKTGRDDDELMACLLTPGTCASKREPSPTPTPVVSKPASDLPEKLESADISDGTRAAKASALSKCGKLARGGEVVKIKLSIAGPTGSVMTAGAESDGGNPGLASCSASELKGSTFKPVQKQQIGAVVTLKF